MKKVFIVLTMSLVFFLSGTKTIMASTGFYEAEYIDGIYMNRYERSTNTIYYQKARFYRRSGDKRVAYCLEPFVKFDPNNNIYDSLSEGINNLSGETWARLSDIVAFGYGYKDHTDPKWYAITQMMIWETVDKNNSFYFTDSLNGNRVNILENERNEIENLITKSKVLPSFTNKHYYGVFGKTLSVTDENNVLGNFSTLLSKNTSVSGNTFSMAKDDEYVHVQTFYSNYRKDSESVLFYYNGKTQQLMTAGNHVPLTSVVTFQFHKLALNLKKTDKDTKSIKGPKETKLLDATFTLYDENMKEITDITFDKEGNASIIGEGENSLLDFKTYYLKETKAGVGYKLDDTLHKITFTEGNTKINLSLENEAIKGNLKIEKNFGDKFKMESEENVSFEIYDIDDELVDTITTDKNGLAEITLNYGHYKIKQKTTTEGYSKVDDFEIFISEDKDYKYKIYDYKEEKTPKIEEIITVEVPDTYTKG